MREVRGLQGRDYVTDRSTGQRARQRDISKVTVNKHQADAESAKAELAAIKAKLGVLGLDLDNLPDALPGATSAVITGMSGQPIATAEEPKTEETKLFGGRGKRS